MIISTSIPNNGYTKEMKQDMLYTIFYTYNQIISRENGPSSEIGVHSSPYQTTLCPHQSILH